ncbi:Helicase associated domain protein [Streptomyces sp. NPDC050485]|uniref:Helicase associated domain protein n=1 Tax=Streptomyces sp. NPDC050485 TaxID=3365617 RepID=UPI0037A4F8F2
MWDTADAQFAENLAAARAYYAEAGTLAAPRHATALDKPVGQWLTNIRRPGGLGKRPSPRRTAGHPTRRGRPGMEPGTATVVGGLAAPLRRRLP